MYFLVRKYTCQVKNQMCLRRNLKYPLHDFQLKDVSMTTVMHYVRQFKLF